MLFLFCSEQITMDWLLPSCYWRQMGSGTLVFYWDRKPVKRSAQNDVLGIMFLFLKMKRKASTWIPDDGSSTLPGFSDYAVFAWRFTYWYTVVAHPLWLTGYTASFYPHRILNLLVLVCNPGFRPHPLSKGLLQTSILTGSSTREARTAWTTKSP